MAGAIKSEPQHQQLVGCRFADFEPGWQI